VVTLKDAGQGDNAAAIGWSIVKVAGQEYAVHFVSATNKFPYVGITAAQWQSEGTVFVLASYPLTPSGPAQPISMQAFEAIVTSLTAA